MEEKNCWKVLKLLANLAHPKKIDYEVENKDGLPYKLKNVKIEEIDLNKEIKE